MCQLAKLLFLITQLASLVQTFWLGFGSWDRAQTQTQTQNPTRPKSQQDPDSEFNSIHFVIEINKCLKFLRPEKYKEIF
jgi:hypothetical protein